jgi:hypothetical protein
MYHFDIQVMVDTRGEIKDTFPFKTIQASPGTNSLPSISINFTCAVGPSVNWLPN